MSVITWNNINDCLPVFVAQDMPLHGKVLAKMSGLSLNQVYYRLRKAGISLSDVRNGLVGAGKDTVERYTVTNVSVRDIKDIVHNVQESETNKTKRAKKAKRKSGKPKAA